MKRFGKVKERTVFHNGGAMEKEICYHDGRVMSEVRSFSKRVRVSSFGEVVNELQNLVEQTKRGDILEFAVSLKVDVCNKKPKWLEKTVIDPESRIGN